MYRVETYQSFYSEEKSGNYGIGIMIGNRPKSKVIKVAYIDSESDHDVVGSVTGLLYCTTWVQCPLREKKIQKIRFYIVTLPLQGDEKPVSGIPLYLIVHNWH